MILNDWQMKFSVNKYKAMYRERNILAIYKTCCELAVTSQGRDEMKTSIRSPNAVQGRIRNGTKNETNILYVINLLLI